MSTKTIDKDAKIVAIPGINRYSIGCTCPKCGCDDWYKANPATQNRAGAGKTKYECRACKIDRKARYRAENADKVKEQQAKYRSENVDKVKEQQAKYYAENVDKVKERKARYYAENPHVYRATNAKRRATKLNATPHWLTEKDLAEIKRIYEECPSGYQVDHILPLQGEHMCGLHVPSNLKPILASENASKCNREPDWTKEFQPGLHP